mgnify:CR=1 FL=1
MTKRKSWMLSILLCMCFMLQGCNTTAVTDDVVTTQETNTATQIEIDTSNEITYPVYSGEAYAVINNNIPFFTDDTITTQTYESYSDLDHLNRP